MHWCIFTYIISELLNKPTYMHSFYVLHFAVHLTGSINEVADFQLKGNTRYPFPSISICFGSFWKQQQQEEELVYLKEMAHWSRWVTNQSDGVYFSPISSCFHFQTLQMDEGHGGKAFLKSSVCFWGGICPQMGPSGEESTEESSSVDQFMLNI